MARRCGCVARMSWVSRWSNGSWRSNSCTTSPISARARAAIMRTTSSTVIVCRSERLEPTNLLRDYMRDLPMPRENSDTSSDSNQRQRALARWDNEGGAGPDGPAAASPDNERAPVPELTNAELVTLRIRVIALENLMISLLATASDQQLQ